ncbi:MAG: hypothetical protein CMQ22_04985 [Gammaproteobacteria bacterium]|nr:hypothetical protein [Gammaproteobacteria bacterium]
MRAYAVSISYDQLVAAIGDRSRQFLMSLILWAKASALRSRLRYWYWFRQQKNWFVKVLQSKI